MSTKKRKKVKQQTTEMPAAASPEDRQAADGWIPRIVKHRAFAAALLFLVSFSVFIPSLRNGLVWDDVTYVRTWAPHLKASKLDYKLFVPSRSEEEKTGKYFRPVYFTSLIMDNRVWGVSPFGFHMTNILLHSVSTVLLYFLILMLFKEFKRGPGESEAFLSSMLFALFPLHVESVSFIAARGDILAGMFFLMCLIFYMLSYRRFYFLILAGVSFYLSFLSKEVAFSFPIIILGFDLISRRMFRRANVIKYLVIGSLLFFYFHVRSGSFMSFMSILHDNSFRDTGTTPGTGEFVTIFLNTYLFYAWKLLFPYDLNHFIGSIAGGDALHTIIAVLFIAAVIAVFIISVMKKENITAFSLLWIFAALGPAVMIAIYPLAITRFAERFVYIPSAGFCLLAGYLIVRGGRLTGKRWAGFAVGGLLCASYLIVTVKGQEPWKDEVTFWETAVRRSPDQIIPRINYGEALRKSGRVDEAVSQHLTAVGPGIESTDRGKAMAASSLASDYIQKGEYLNAEKYLKAALEYNPKTEGQYNYHMGLIYLRKNDPVTAGNYLRKAVEVIPDFVKAHYLLGMAYFMEADEDRSADKYGLAVSSLKLSIRYGATDMNARILLARVYLALGDRENARREAEYVLRNAFDPVILRNAESILNAIDESP
ncbi:MAG: tetratricopeptide repeat protein [Thermodesulfobacteriota bacterium]